MTKIKELEVRIQKLEQEVADIKQEHKREYLFNLLSGFNTSEIAREYAKLQFEMDTAMLNTYRGGVGYTC